MKLYYKDEYIRLFQGDCLEAMDRLIEKGVKFDAIITDPPYGTTACTWDTIIPFNNMWERLNKLIKDKGVVLLNASQPFTSELIHSNLELFKYCWYWEKEKGTGFAFSGKQPLRKIEEICVFYKKQPYYNSEGKKLDKPYKHTLPISKSKSGGISSNNLNEDGSRKYVEYTHEKKNNLLYFSRDNANKGLHPTQKPVALCEYLINTYTNENELILDFTCGSGSTLVASKNLKRKCIGIELEEKYCEIAKQRLENS